MNSITISGNLGQDPDIKHFESGSRKVTFSVAVYGGKKGNDVITHWHNCEAWNEVAESIVANLKKGDRVLIAGESRIETWESEGKTRSRQIVNVREFGIIPKREARPVDDEQLNQYSPPPVSPADIPF